MTGFPPRNRPPGQRPVSGLQRLAPRARSSPSPPAARSARAAGHQANPEPPRRSRPHPDGTTMEIRNSVDVPNAASRSSGRLRHCWHPRAGHATLRVPVIPSAPNRGQKGLAMAIGILAAVELGTSCPRRPVVSQSRQSSLGLKSGALAQKGQEGVGGRPVAVVGAPHHADGSVEGWRRRTHSDCSRRRVAHG